MPIRILIADDHGVLRAGLRAMLNAEPDHEVIGEASDGPTALRLAAELSPDVLLLDVSMPGMTGIEVTRQLKKTRPETRVLILTLHEDEGLLQQAIQAGASGYIVKRAVETELMCAIQAVHRGDIYIHPTMTRALFKDVSPLLVPEKEQTEPLSPREAQVLRHVAEGRTNRQIAEMLHVSVRTVESHRANVMDKLSLSRPAQLVRYAFEHGLVE
jgi:two-component system, NarL family, response regulator NreC